MSYYCIEANHNKDYSVVKTFKVAQVAFFCARQYRCLKLMGRCMFKNGATTSIPDKIGVHLSATAVNFGEAQGIKTHLNSNKFPAKICSFLFLYHQISTSLSP